MRAEVVRVTIDRYVLDRSVAREHKHRLRIGAIFDIVDKIFCFGNFDCTLWDTRADMLMRSVDSLSFFPGHVRLDYNRGFCCPSFC